MEEKRILKGVGRGGQESGEKFKPKQNNKTKSIWIYEHSSKSPAKLHFGLRIWVSLLPSMSLRENFGVFYDLAGFCFDSREGRLLEAPCGLCSF